ncbi:MULTISPECIES: hypothetical protein [Leptospira]|uniref:hypothetical protein n=1 Tax=Leptospira TaxID=171 RepID=UPI00029299E1|nr:MULTISPECIES: hypothetical protein [Leptospira]EKO79925.1 hypothetical protein LEP1GSC068_0363 [Leptospira sp. Fiocruz LV3954]EMI64021.1 hypothetical protein LEP1GSC076_2470 [Leptospira sp. Fiocruz LV4135]EMO31185.1 hypothetical protein LEP1GSC175_0170 [Leptospira santarosai str. HAI821]
MKGWFLILLLIPTLLFSESSVSDDCTFKGRKSYGRIILVSSIRIFAFKIDPSFGVFTIQFDLRKKIYVMNPCAELIFFKSRP